MTSIAEQIAALPKHDAYGDFYSARLALAVRLLERTEEYWRSGTPIYEGTQLCFDIRAALPRLKAR